MALEQSGTRSTLNAVIALDNGMAIAVGEAGAIATRHLDGSWSVYSSDADYSLRSGAAAGQYVVVVGESGTILQSGDYGESWRVVESGVVEDLHGVALHAFAPSAVAVGDGVVMRSDDNGQTWMRLAFPSSVGSLRAVGVRSRSGVNDFLAVGASGEVLLSRDLGRAWHQVDVGTVEDLYSVGLEISPALDKERFVITGAHGTSLLMVDDEGLDWVDFKIDNESDIVDISSDNYWYLGKRGLISGEGVHVQLPSSQDSEFLAIDGNNYDEAWAVGENGIIAHLVLSRELCLNPH